MGEQMSLAEALLHPRMGCNAKLAAMNAQVSWEPIAQLAARVRVPAATGRKPYPALAMLKGLYLQSAYDLGDQEMEEALVDRLAFRRFCGFALDEATPDATTILRFRADAAAAGVLCGVLGRGQPAARGQGPGALEGHAGRRHADQGRAATRRRGRGRPGRGPSQGAGRRRDAQERQGVVRLQAAISGMDEGSGAACGAPW